MVTTSKRDHGQNVAEKKEDKSKITDTGRTKEFKVRNSILTDLCEDTNMKTVYNICVALFIVTVTYYALYELIYERRISIGTTLIKSGLEGFHIVVPIWFGMFFSGILLYGGFSYWALYRIPLQLMSGNTLFWDIPWTILYIAYLAGLLYFPSYGIIKYELGIISSLIVLIEQFKFLMKSYSFVRYNFPKHLTSGIEAKLAIVHPSVWYYTYYLFVPTMVYHDKYPRSNQKINWSSVIRSLLQLAGGIVFFAMLWENSYKLDLMNYGLKTMTFFNVTFIIFKNAILSLILTLLLFYCFTHCYLNLLAEILQFEDRLFYKDWWLTSSLEQFLKTWTVVMYDWVYIILYKDLHEIIFPKQKVLSKVTVSMILAIAYDIIACIALRICLPLNSLFCVVVILLLHFANLKLNSFGNVFVWCSLGFLTSGWFTIYTMEYYARINCPLAETSTYSYLLPRYLVC